jgi:hypothetical protein
MPNENHHLVNYSLLESLHAKGKGDIYDHCLIFFSDILVREDKLSPITVKGAQTIFKDYLNLTIPLAATKIILGRGTKKNNFFTLRNDHYTPIKENIEKVTFSFDQNKELCIRQNNKFYDELRKFTKDTHQVDLTIDQSEDAFRNYVAKYQIEIIDSFDDKNKAVKTKGGSVINEDYLISTFLEHINRSEPDLFEYFVKIFRGIILTRFVVSEPIRDNVDNLKNVTIYLDTPILMGILGFNGPSKETVYSEMVELCKKTGVRLRVFDCTIVEFENVIKAMTSDLESKNLKGFRDDTLALLKKNGWDAIYLKNFLIRYPQLLLNLKIETEASPKGKDEFQIDSAKLESDLAKSKSEFYKNPHHDIKCVENIIQLRRYAKRVTFQDKVYIFITTNNLVLNTVNQFFKDELDHDSAPVVSNDLWISNLCWVLKPDLFPDWPKHVIEANYKAIIYGDDVFWKDFVKRLKNYRKEGKISAEDYKLVRRESLTKESLKLLSIKEGFDYSDESAFELIEKTKQRILGEKDFKIDQLQNAVNQYQFKLKKFSDGCGKYISWFAMLIVTGFLILGYFYSGLISSKILIFSMTLVTVVAMFFGWTIWGAGKKMEAYLSGAFYRLLDNIIKQRDS